MICFHCKIDSNNPKSTHPYVYVVNAAGNENKPFRCFICNSCYEDQKAIMLANLKTNKHYSIRIVKPVNPWIPKIQ